MLKNKSKQPQKASQIQKSDDGDHSTLKKKPIGNGNKKNGSDESKPKKTTTSTNKVTFKQQPSSSGSSDQKKQTIIESETPEELANDSYDASDFKSMFKPKYRSKAKSKKQEQEQEEIEETEEIEEEENGNGKEIDDDSELLNQLDDEDDEPMNDFDDDESIESSDSELEEETPIKDSDKHNKMIAKIMKLSGNDDQNTQLTNGNRKRKREEQTESFPESEHNITKGADLTLEDLLGAVDKDVNLGDAKQQLNRLEKRRKKTELAEPLPHVVAEKLVREVGYKQAHKDLKKWQGFVQNMSEKDHIQFPLDEQKHNRSAGTLVSEFTPETNMEKQIAEILKQSGMDEKTLNDTSDLPTAKLSLEDIEKRNQEMSKMKQMLFYQELKKRRQNKIKSRSYRRLVRKGKEKNELSLDQLRKINPELASKEEEKRAMKRIKERMTLKHTRSGKPKKAMDTESKRALSEQANLKQELMKKMESAYSDDEAEDEVQQPHYDELPDQQRDDQPELPEKGLFAMGFMKRAMERERVEAMDEEERAINFKQDLALGDIFTAVPAGKKLKSNLRNEENEENNETEEKNNNDNQEDLIKLDEDKPTKAPSTNVMKSSAPLNVRVPKQKKQQSNVSETQAGINPWLDSTNTNVLSKRHTQEDTTANQNKKEVVLDISKTISLTNNALKKKETSNKQQQQDKFDLLADASEEQKKLIESVFVTDDEMVRKFAKEKQDTIEDEGGAAAISDLHKNDKMPGWGAWAGEGVKARKISKKRQMMEKKREEEAKAKVIDARQDSKLKHVIISEKRNKKAAKYAIGEVPYPFQSKEQYEMSLRVPLGKDWNSLASFQKLTKPSVSVKPGLLINPLTLSAAKSKLAKVSEGKQKQPTAASNNNNDEEDE